VIKKIFKAIGLMLGLFILVSAGIVVSDLTYWKRLFTAPMDEMVTAVDWYGPLEALSGSAPTAELPAGPAVSITPAALQAAIAYGTETESVSLLVYHRGQLVLEHYWPGFGPDTRTDPASMHKSVLAMAVGLAIGDGLIDSVDAPASRWLTEWQGDERATITVKDLLTMSSGLAVVPFSPNPFGNFFKFLRGGRGRSAGHLRLQQHQRAVAGHFAAACGGSTLCGLRGRKALVQTQRRTRLCLAG
jgi:CubicO group peptidase (beta-lactamase class C family)